MFQGGPEIGGIFVRTLLPGGAAEQTGSILVGTTLGSIFSSAWRFFVPNLGPNKLLNSIKYCNRV